MSNANVYAFSCLRCNRCCFFSNEKECPVVLPYEARYLAILAKCMDIPELRFERTLAGFYTWIVTGYCPFYDAASKACRIHYEKPIACRMFPLLVDPSTLELSVSSTCKWIKRNLSKLADLSEKVEEVFPSEFNAVRELITVLYNTAGNGLVSLILLGDDVGDLLGKLTSKCSVIKFLKSNVVRGLYLALLSGCSKDYVESTLHDIGEGVRVSYVDDVSVMIKSAEQS